MTNAEPREGFVSVFGGALALFLQVVVAPNIALGGVVPNFVLAWCLVMAIVRPQRSGLVLPFVLGLAFDLMGSGPVGAMSFLLVLATFAASRLFGVVDNGTLFMPLTILIAATLFVEMAYGLFLVSTGAGISFVDAFFYRGLPCSLYDAVIGLLMFPVCLRFLASGQRPDMTQLR